MTLISTSLARLGSRYSIILDPSRREIHYGALGLMCQRKAGLLIAVEQDGRVESLPLAAEGEDFFCIDQQLTMTSVRFEAQSLALGVSLSVKITAPFWPQDEKTSLVPAYIFDFTVRHLDSVRWNRPPNGVSRKGRLRFALRLKDIVPASRDGGLVFRYPVAACDVFRTGEGGEDREYRDDRRRTPLRGEACDRMIPLAGAWRPGGGELSVAYDVSTPGAASSFSAALAGYCGDAMFERFGKALPLKYTRYWKNIDAVAGFVRRNAGRLRARSDRFDSLFTHNGLPVAARNTMATAFQSYLMCTLWATGAVPGRDGRPSGRKDWFSVWEGSCWFNSTVDVTYNEAPFYFACWPGLLELLFDEWSDHANDREAEKRRCTRAAGGKEVDVDDFPGAILEHDMGAGWSANGQSYHHGMPVEENANFLLLLYTHGRWWGRTSLFSRHAAVCRQLASYLIWSDTTGNGFPDRGTANTIDDANPAVQYGRDNVYLGVKRLCALHAAAGIFAHIGDTALAAECRGQVRKAISTLDRHWLGDHYPVVLDRSAKGIRNAWSGEPLPYRTLPGWDAYSLYTTNGLLLLQMIGDLPPGLDSGRMRTDLLNSLETSMTPYGTSHSSHDDSMVWISMNMWRDSVAAYLGVNLLHMNERYWGQQEFANGAGSEKANCFTETSLRNNLVWYPRGTAAFAYTFACAGLVLDRAGGRRTVAPVAPGAWPLLPLADWKTGKVPAATCEQGAGTGSGRKARRAGDGITGKAATGGRAGRRMK